MIEIYTLKSGEDDVNGIIILDYNRIYINDPTVGSTVTIQIVALPDEDNLTSLIRAGDENALKYYILSKAYEKDTDMGNFQKSGIFYQKYEQLFKKLREANNANYRTNTIQTTKATYY